MLTTWGRSLTYWVRFAEARLHHSIQSLGIDEQVIAGGVEVVDYRLVTEVVTLVKTTGQGVGWGTGCLCQQQSPALSPYFLFHTLQQRSADALFLRLPRSAEPVQVESALGEGMGAIASKP
jgi:hypothetical protein